ncbi:hypothetical protein AB5I41_29485 [Sphingomonas sp. MMS24-JH45]
MATVTAFAAEGLARGAWARARYGRYAILADARAMPVQSATVAGAIETLVSKSILLSDAPYAFVATSMLLKLQADRVVNQPDPDLPRHGQRGGVARRRVARGASRHAPCRLISRTSPATGSSTIARRGSCTSAWPGSGPPPLLRPFWRRG